MTLHYRAVEALSLVLIETALETEPRGQAGNVDTACSKNIGAPVEYESSS